MGRGVAESRDYNSVHEYASTRVREDVRRTDVSTYRCTERFTIELGIVLKGPLSLPK